MIAKLCLLDTDNEKHYRPIQAHFPLTIQNWMTEKVSFIPSEEEPTDEESQEELLERCLKKYR